MSAPHDGGRLVVRIVDRGGSLDPESEPPAHHVVSPAPATPAAPTRAASGWSSYMPQWRASPQRSRSFAKQNKPLTFRNPWPSWRKPGLAEVAGNLEWGADLDPCINLAASRLSTVAAPPNPPEQSRRPTFGDIKDWPNSTGAKAARLLAVQEPDLSFPQPSGAPGQAKAKVTWLGHATILLQLPALPGSAPGSRPLRCLFDPMFSMRCSPSQSVGPIRSYPPPCAVEALPPIDAVFISHNHYDHLDLDTILAVWKHSRDVVRFFVPLGNRQWFLDSGVDPDRVFELDWWDGAELTSSSAAGTTTEAGGATPLKIWCTPAQHSSGRVGFEVDSALWASWTLEYPRSADPNAPNPPCRIFFAGDTGYQFHPSAAWPPKPGQEQDIEEDDTQFPACPAFADIRARLGPPQLLLLPIALGATYAYMRSMFLPFPQWINPFPRHSEGLMAATHMPPWDAVRVMRLMASASKDDAEATGAKTNPPQAPENKPSAVAVAMHWGTFATDPAEILKTLGQLEYACQRQGVRFARSLGEKAGGDGVELEEKSEGDGTGLCFLALNQGQSVDVDIA
ncbi:beta-lactamase superfamily domain-containing protein [Lasiosphaeria ovina]|uniref:Beta-lactamase superfamily domain-containing protein n=1 Tax=Lasiosphaeria ovina TaxID=92902 RepID=A0AAE0JTQ9_9PEZI|nr:beta-lactamase superfamily domain-containing protein [Lasiosphaeria ovina]